MEEAYKDSKKYTITTVDTHDGNGVLLDTKYHVRAKIFFGKLRRYLKIATYHRCPNTHYQSLEYRQSIFSKKEHAENYIEKFTIGGWEMYMKYKIVKCLHYDLMSERFVIVYRSGCADKCHNIYIECDTLQAAKDKIQSWERTSSIR